MKDASFDRVSGIKALHKKCPKEDISSALTSYEKGFESSGKELSDERVEKEMDKSLLNEIRSALGSERRNDPKEVIKGKDFFEDMKRAVGRNDKASDEEKEQAQQDESKE